MQDQIEVNLDRVKSIIDAFDSGKFSTADVLRDYGGGFFSNKETPVHYSFNAQFGKILKRNEANLGITEVESNFPITDDNGNNTSASLWVKK